MLKEHDQVVLTEDVPEKGLQAGDIGVVVFVPEGNESYTVEFLTLHGTTVAILPVRASQVRPISAEDLPHARRIPA
jgi:hypothetical protein